MFQAITVGKRMGNHPFYFLTDDFISCVKQDGADLIPTQNSLTATLNGSILNTAGRHDILCGIPAVMKQMFFAFYF